MMAPGDTRGMKAKVLDEAKLIRRAADGDHGAFERLWLLHEEDILWYVLSRTRTRDVAEDLLVEIGLKCWKGLLGFDGRARFKTWLFRIAINACADHHRRRASAGRERCFSELEHETTRTEPSYPSPGPLDECIRAEEHASLREAIERLPTEQRELLTLVRTKGLGVTAVAELLGKTKYAVGMQLHRALRRLREFLGASELSPRAADGKARRA